jgi:uncharacterized protein (TIGR03435 family)
MLKNRLRTNGELEDKSRHAAAVARGILAGCLSVCLMWSAAGRASAQAAPAFEVASIKPSDAFMNWSGFRPFEGGRFEGSHDTVKSMVAWAYEVPEFYVSGGAGWTGTDRFDIDGRADASTTPKQMRAMLQTLLADRFQLALHRETKDTIVYQLVVAKGGPKLKESVSKSGFLKFAGRGQIEGTAINMTGLANYLQTLLGLAVVDKTGLAANYDFNLSWTPDEAQGGKPGAQAIGGNAGDDTGPSVFTALQEQLGLRLESGKEPIQMLVIDRVEKP